MLHTYRTNRALLIIVLLVAMLPALMLARPVAAASPYAAVTAIEDSAYPTDVAIDTANHRLFVAESHAHRVLVYALDAQNNLIDDEPEFVIGQPDFTARQSQATRAGLNCAHLCALAYDTERQVLFVADSSNGRVLIFALHGGIANGMEATHVLGKPDFTASACVAASDRDMCTLRGDLVYDGMHQRLFVADAALRHRVLVFDVARLGSYLQAEYVIGQSDFTTSATGRTASQLALDYAGLALDADGQRLFVSDRLNHRVLAFNVTPSTMSNGMAATHVLGQSDFTAGVRATTQTGLSYPQGLAVDQTRRQLYVFNRGSQRVTIYDAANLQTNAPAVGVYGQPDFTTGGSSGGSGPGAMSANALGLGFEPNTRRLLVPDAMNRRVMAARFAHVPAQTLPVGTVGASYDATVQRAGVQGSATWSVAAGDLPPGLVLDAATGVISGASQQAGVFDFTVTLTDANGASGTFVDSRPLTITVAVAPGTGHGSEPDAEQPPEPPPRNDDAAQEELPLDEDLIDTGQELPDDLIAQADSEPQEEQTQESSSKKTAETITLSEQCGFYSDKGQTVMAGAGQVISFCLENTEQCPETHTATVKTIDAAAGTVLVTFASEPQDVRLVKGQPAQVDLNADGQPDITAELTSIDGEFVKILFTRSGQASAQVLANQALQQQPGTPPAAEAEPNAARTWIAAACLALIAAAILLAWRRNIITWRRSKS